MSVDRALLREVRKLMRRYSERRLRKATFMVKLGKLICEMERDAYEAPQDVKRQKP